jgi:hypothetical protein
VGFLGVMVGTGRMRQSEQYVVSEPAGLMREQPDRIDRVELAIGTRRLLFVREPGGPWRRSGGAAVVPVSVRGHLEMSLRFMHATAPVRVMSPEEYRGAALREFGLDPPRYTVSLHRGGDTVLATRFGSSTPQEVLQYVWVTGRHELYLLPVFVGREWERVADWPRAAPG